MATLVSVETTPNPNSMKLNLSEPLGITGTFRTADQAMAPGLIQQLLRITGVESIFVAADFLTVNRDPRSHWQPILSEAKALFTGEKVQPITEQTLSPSTDTQEQVQVLVQTFRGIPLQVKVTDGATEQRAGLPVRFGNVARELQAHFGANYLTERHWADWGVRYGTLQEVAAEVAEEIETLLDEAALEARKQLALNEKTTEKPTTQTTEAARLQLAHPDWNKRFQAVQQLEASEETLPLVIQALHDEKPQIRRWAAAKLAGIKTAEAVKALSEALLHDPHVGVRRTAGDSLSDIGDVAAQNAACQALRDNNKLVRWRAARFLAEVGTEAALPFLEQARNEPEYEVKLEIEAAIQHIREGTKAALPAWKLMTQENNPAS